MILCLLTTVVLSARAATFSGVYLHEEGSTGWKDSYDFYSENSLSLRYNFDRTDENVWWNKLPAPMTKAEQACRRYKHNLKPHASLYIVGGSRATLGEYPHMVLLGARGSQGKITWWCGGSLVSEQWVLTAAHCQVSKIRDARLGVVEMKDKRAKDFRVVDWRQHPSYDRMYHDLALVQLSDPVHFSNLVLPACLYWKDQLPGTGLVATGWGTTFGVGFTLNSVLLKAHLQPVPLALCNSTYEDNNSRLGHGVTRDVICAKDPLGKMDTCNGDSGGPLQVQTEESSPLSSIVGVTSYSLTSCGGSVPTVYTRVSTHLPWLESVVWP